jgi:chromosome segregation ATPase
MKKVKNINSSNAPKNTMSGNLTSRQTSTDMNCNINVKDKINIVLGDKIKELQNTLKVKKDQNAQLLNQLQSLSDKSNELVSKRNKLLVNINQQKSQIFVLKNKNKAYRNYLSELTSKDSSSLSNNKKQDDVFNSIAKLSENISGNIIEINKILNENSDKLKLDKNDLLKNIPVDFLKNLPNKNNVIK